MLRANQAVRLGLRAASRNPELAFGRALIDQTGNVLAFLPLVLAALFVFGLLDRTDVAGALEAIRALQWPTLGAIAAAAALAFSGGMLFWAGALPLLAADAEMNRRPPAGNFALLAARGFARVLLAGIAGAALSILFPLACTVALLAALPALAVKPSPLLLAGAALIASLSVAGGVLFDLAGRLLLVRAGSFGESVSVAFGKAVSLLSARLGACVVVSVAFLVLDLITATVAGTLTGVISSASFLDPGVELVALAPRIGVTLAAAVVFAWLEVGRMAALSALALDGEGLIEPPAPAPVSPPPVAEPVIEALPVDEP